MFRKITVSSEILMDNAKRNYLDTKLEDDRRKRAKYEQLDKKRREMVDALNAREENAKKAKVEQVQRRREQAEEEEIKEAGKKMLEEAQRRAAAASAAAAVTAKQSNGSSTHGATTFTDSSAQAGPSRSSQPSSTKTNGHASSPPPKITSDDLTLILTFPPLSTVPSSSSSLQSILESRYGPIAHLILKDPPAPVPDVGGGGRKKKKGKGKKAVVEFSSGNWGGCWACWQDHVDGEIEHSAQHLDQGIKVRWLKGETPSWIEWASNQGQDRPLNGTGTHHADIPSSATNGTLRNLPPSFGSAPELGNGGTTMADLLASHKASKDAERAKRAKEDEFESMTLLRMRQSERQRLADQIRREEEEEEDGGD
ncbi:hypothetical protein BD324DRAFT_193290 [Kockovaella imperatae]|uniref:Uncharacterized protein n=1 Tax=Kockovaella imperatae TaxID=4999 RepID=A0A1Y1U919_9TREE|nr:hypothetical protein BD324DRAFT_193290 [Kockovaella imperatae]ORX34034.1 hypothetical protein BD324DRAFT_193290 [Kockovaella imperatae]